MRDANETTNAELVGIICSGTGAFIGAFSKSCFKLSWLLQQRDQRQDEAAMRISKIMSPMPSPSGSPEPADSPGQQGRDLLLTPGQELNEPLSIPEATLDQAGDDVPQGPLAVFCPSSPWTVFYLGIVVAPLEVILDLIAFYMAPQRLISPMSGLVLVANLFLASFLLGETVVAHDITVCVTIVSGIVCIGYSTTESDLAETFPVLMDRFGRYGFHVYLSIVLGILLLVFGVMWCPFPRDSRMGSLQRHCMPACYGILAGIFGGQQYFTKLATQFFHDSCHTPWDSLLPYTLMVVAVIPPLTGLYIVNQGLQYYDALVVMPVFQATVIAVGTGSAGAFWGGMETMTRNLFLTYLTGVGLILFGVVILTTKPNYDADATKRGGSESGSGDDERGPIVSIRSKHSPGEETERLLPLGASKQARSRKPDAKAF